ncbi:sugar transferase [bacterium SCSIO 12741]|nr:sugar transferase [bacterium SCSIO 12741]
MLNRGRKQQMTLNPGGLGIALEHVKTSQHATYARVLDVTFSLLVFILLLWWFIPLVGLLIRLDTKGPIFYRQIRSGKDGKPFMCLKFRTMYNRNWDFKQASRNDPRVTRIGRWLRKTNLDEIPQFINVLRNEMSVIGPRPHTPELDKQYDTLIDDYYGRLAVKPGITGLAQVKGYRGETINFYHMANRVRLDLFYIHYGNLAMDIRIIFETARQIFVTNENAY